MKYKTLLKGFGIQLKPKSPNILFLTIDALRADRMGFHSYSMDTTPVLDAMAKKSIWCKNAFSLVGTTQPSFPTIFTSTRPLSYGGYDRGIVNRPNSISEVLRDAGYRTMHLLTFPWVISSYGFERGVEYSEHLYRVRWIVGGALNTIKSTISAYRNGQVSMDELMEDVLPVIRRCLQDIILYCDKRETQKDIEDEFFRFSSFVQDKYNLSSVKAIVGKHLNEFEKGPQGYVLKHIMALTALNSDSWITAHFHWKRKPMKFMSMGWDLAAKLASFFIKDPRLHLRPLRFKSYVDGADLTDRIIALLRVPRDKPFFLWTHYVDTHIPYAAGRSPNWFIKTREYLNKVGYPDNPKKFYLGMYRDPKSEREIVSWRRFYDASVRYVDEQIGRILEALDKTGNRENTLLVISGDHGEEIGEHGDFSHRFRMYDESIHVPLIFHHPDLKEKRVNGLVDLRDLAPTVLDIIGLPIPDSYEGIPVTEVSNGNRKHILLECFYRGNCLFKHRPLYMGVRTRNYKYIWREWIDPSDKISKDRVELYDILKDKEEKNNLYRDGSRLVEEFNGVIRRRLREIPEIVAARGEGYIDNLR